MCLALTFAACTNNVDTSDDGDIEDGTTTDGGENNTTDNTQGGNNDDQGAEDNDTEDNISTETKRITSDTGTGINLVIEYSVGAIQNGSRKIDVTLYLESYSISVTARGNTNYVRVGDETVYFSTDAISYDGTEKKLTRFAEHTFTVNTDNDTVPIYALWHFNGVYSGKPISAIIIENNIEL